MIIRIFTCFLLISSSVSWAQPATNIYLFKIEDFKKHGFVLSEPNIINDAEGVYNNQPHFFEDKIYYSSIRNGKTSDIFEYDMSTFSTSRITNTPTISEFSPTVMFSKKFLSTVEIEADGKTQRLWKVFRNGKTNQSLIMDNVFNVGYHAWLDAHHLALFIVGEPHKLVYTHVKTQETIQIAENIGRCIQITPRGDLSYVQVQGDRSFLKVWNFDTKQTSSITELLSGSEDYAWLPDNTLIMAVGSKLYTFRTGKDNEWRLLTDLSVHGINDISRIAVKDKNTIAIVSSIKQD